MRKGVGREMPWNTKGLETMREEFVKRVLAKEKSKKALCQEYGISRPTGDKWIKRYLAGESLSDRSRRPFHTPNRISEWAEHRIVQARKQEPAIGAQKLHRMLQNDGWHDPPSVSTINAVFKRNGLITPQASEKARRIPRFEMAAPNVMWQADFKGDFSLRDKTRCYPLSLLDDHSRFCLCADAKGNMQFPGVFESFQRVFRTYGLPQRLLCDNGVPWGSNQKEYITAFDVWLMELGILVIHIRPYRPQTQGKVERFNGSYTQERLQFYLPADLADAQRTREEYRHFYNEKRPHHALGLNTPATCYRESSRSYPERIPEWDYGWKYEVRKVDENGMLCFKRKRYFLSEGLRGKYVALYPSSKEDGVFHILFREFRIAKLDLKEGVVSSKKIYLREGDPRSKV